MHPYRTHTCGEIRPSHEGQTVRLSGWIHRKRDHGQLLFIDLRDHYGITQCVLSAENDLFKKMDQVRLESVLTITGQVVKRTPETTNKDLPTGAIEILADHVHVESAADILPLQVNSDVEFPEETRLKYRFLDLRREKLHRNIVLRNKFISSLRRRMTDAGFMEFQTPILTASSPEGARDFLVPSRMHPGKFYALPQAPQQFKQLLMMAGFDRYFQIAPCFRDEDARADRSPGEFYQLDLEMSYVTQEDVFQAVEPILHDIFVEFADGYKVSPCPFPRITFDDAMLKYGCDKPDLRNPLLLHDATEIFRGSDFGIFAKAIENGSVIRAIPAPNSANLPRSFFDKLNGWAQEMGAPGMGYIIFAEDQAKGPIAKYLTEERLTSLKAITGCKEGDAIFFLCDKLQTVTKLAGQARIKIGTELNLIEEESFAFCWIIDFPMYELNQDTGKIEFTHNPFSMPQGGLEALTTKNPLDIKAFQYDIVCNGIELCSGGIRNHLPEVMVKALEIAGYTQADIERRFDGMFRAFHYGAPPHGGCAPGIDRMVMLLAREPNLREVIAFPLNQQAQDLLMGAPDQVSETHLKELHIRIVEPPAPKK